jgi:hypothetical protein
MRKRRRGEGKKGEGEEGDEEKGRRLRRGGEGKE